MARSRIGSADRHSQSEAIRLHDPQVGQFAKHYDEVALDRYKSFFTYKRHHIVSILDRQLGPPPGRLLDVGCGTGHMLAERAEHGYTPIGCDGSQAMLREAASCQMLTGLAQAYVTNLPFVNGAFDSVISVEVLRWLPAPVAQQALREVLRVLRPGGVAVVSFAPAWNTWLYRGLVWLASVARLRRPQLASCHAQTAGTLERVFRDLGFHEVEVEARMFGPFALVERLLPHQFKWMAAWWDQHTGRLNRSYPSAGS